MTTTDKKSYIKFILFTAFIFLIFIGFFEIILRTTHLFNARISCIKPDPKLGWRPIPDCNYWQNKENDHPITGRYNSYGWRDKEWSLEKPPNTYRYAIIGDSYVEALQVESDHTFLALAEKKINENYDGRIEIMNFGRSAFTQTEELLILKEEVAKFSPDMVVLFFLPSNDIDDVRRETAPIKMRPFYELNEAGELLLDTSFVEMSGFRLKSIINPLKTHSAIISLIAARYNYFNLKKKTPPESGITVNSSHQLNGYLSLCTNSPDPKYVKSYALNKRLIKSMAEFCEKRGIKFMLITNNNMTYIPKFEEHYKSIDPSFDANYFEDDLKSFSDSLKIDYIGLQRIFRRDYEINGLELHWGHWNYQGHELVARALTSKLRTIMMQDAEAN